MMQLVIEHKFGRLSKIEILDIGSFFFPNLPIISTR